MGICFPIVGGDVAQNLFDFRLGLGAAAGQSVIRLAHVGAIDDEEDFGGRFVQIGPAQAEEPIFFDPMHGREGFHFVHPLPPRIRHQDNHCILLFHLLEGNFLVEPHPCAQTGHIHNAQIAAHKQIGHALLGVNAESGRAHEANLPFLASLKAIFAQMGQRVGVVPIKHLRRGGFHRIQVAVAFIAGNAIEQNLEIFVPLCFGRVFVALDNPFNVEAGLFPLTIVGDVEGSQFGQFAQANHSLGKLFFGPKFKGEGFVVFFGRLFNINNRASHGRNRPRREQIAAEQRINQRTFANPRAAKKDQRIGLLLQNSLGLLHTCLCLWHSPHQIIPALVNRLL